MEKVKASPFSGKQEISDSPSGLSVQRQLEGVSLPFQMAAVETPAARMGFNLRAALKGGVSARVGLTMNTCRP
jgi:hypothetical protein